jgi:RNA polymerase sigma-70 factor (sigma-E family)
MGVNREPSRKLLGNQRIKRIDPPRPCNLSASPRVPPDRVKRPVATTQPQAQVALRAAFEEHYVSLLRLCTALSRRRDLAEDIVQDAFVRVAPRVADLGPDEVGPYLRRVVVNLWKDRLRRLAIELKHVRQRPPPQVVESQAEERDAVWSALLRLPSRQRACVVLRYYEDLPEREVAEVLRCSVGTVKSQTSRALSKLRRELADED